MVGHDAKEILYQRKRIGNVTCQKRSKRFKLAVVIKTIEGIDEVGAKITFEMRVADAGKVDMQDGVLPLRSRRILKVTFCELVKRF